MPSPLVTCLPIGPHRLQRNDESRTLIVDSLLIKFTPTEYRLLVVLLSGQPVTDNDLAQAAFSCIADSSVRESLDKHIDKIRMKLRPSGIDVHRILKYGYVLLSIT